MCQSFQYLKILILSIALMQAPMIPVYAQSEANSTEQVDESSSETQPSSNLARTEIQQGEDASGDMIGEVMQLVTVIAIGMLAKTMITYTPITTDLMIAAAAGAVFIYGEISALEVTKEKLDGDTFVLTSYEDGSSNDTQKEALEKQRDSYQDVSEILEQKAQLQKTAGAGFLVAAAAALVTDTKLKMLSAKCVTAVLSYAGTCAGANGDGCKCLSSEPVIESAEAFIQAYEAAPDSPSKAKVASLQAKSVSLESTIAAACPPAVSICGTRGALRKAVYSMSSLPVGWSMVVAVGGGLMLEKMGLGSMKGLVMAAFTPYSSYFDTLMASPVMRSVAFVAMGGLALAGSKKTEEQSEKMKENVETIDNMLKKVEERQSNQIAESDNQTQSGQINGNLMASDSLAAEKNREANYKCPDNEPRGEDGKCNSMKEKIGDGMDKTLNGVNGLGGLLASSAGQLGNVADSFANTGGLDAGAFEDSQTLASNANALRDLTRGLQRELNSKRKANGIAQVDFDAQTQGLKDKMQKAIVKTVKNNPQESQALQAILAGRSVKKPEEKQDEDKEAESLSSTQGSKEASGTQAYKMPDDSSSEIDFDFGDPEENEGLSYNSDGETVVNVDGNLDTDGTQIVKNKDVSIFKVISVRYLKSGIPRLIDLE